MKMKRKKKTEDSNARKEIWRSVFEPYVPPIHGDLGYVSYYSTPETSRLTEHPPQTKTLDHRPPMSQAEFDASVLQLSACPVTHRPQFGPRCQGGYSRRHTSQDDCQGVFRLILCSIEGGWKGADCWVRPARLCLRHVPHSRWSSKGIQAKGRRTVWAPQPQGMPSSITYISASS
jgi:hypothetical protein